MNRDPTISLYYLPAFDACPKLVALDITEEKLKGAAGAGGPYSETIASWLLKFGTPPQGNYTIGKVAVK